MQNAPRLLRCPLPLVGLCRVWIVARGHGGASDKGPAPRTSTKPFFSQRLQGKGRTSRSRGVTRGSERASARRCVRAVAPVPAPGLLLRLLPPPAVLRSSAAGRSRRAPRVLLVEHLLPRGLVAAGLRRRLRPARRGGGAGGLSALSVCAGEVGEWRHLKDKHSARLAIASSALRSSSEACSRSLLRLSICDDRKRERRHEI